LDSLSDPMAILDGQGIIRSVNAAWRQFAGRSGSIPAAASPVGINYFRVCEQTAGRADGAEGTIALDGMREVLDGRRAEFHLEYPRHALHEQHWFRMTVTRVPGPAAMIAVIHRNITAHKRVEIAAKLAQAMLRQATEEDPLTGLPNRMMLMQWLVPLMKRRRVEAGIRFALLLLHIEGLPFVNRALGHEAGDDMVHALGRRLRDAQSPGSFVARFGDHEFVYVARGVDENDEARALADQLLATLSSPLIVQGHDLWPAIEIAIGIATSRDAATPQELLRQASVALSAARESGFESPLLRGVQPH
jgi:diguanylate cyclase (GGDEF)-like protein